MPHDVFISYSSHDKAVADAACAALEAQKIRCWIAPRDVPPATDFANEIVKAIDDCRAMVLVFSAKANKSANIGSEVYLAFSREIPIVSLRIENVAPEGAMKYRLGKTHWLDALTPPLEKRIEELTESVSRLLGSGKRAINSQTPSKKKNRKIADTSTDSTFLRTANESAVEELAGESLTKLIEQGKLFKSSDYPLSRNHFEEAGYLETYPPEFDCWVLEAKSVIEQVFKANSLARSLLKEGLATYKSFKVFKQRQDLDRIQHLLIQALKSGMKAASVTSTQPLSPPKSELQSDNQNVPHGANDEQKPACKIEWSEAPYSTLTVHVDRPLFENFIGDWFYRGREGDECPELYRLLLKCPGIQGVSRSGPYALLMSHSELAKLEQALPCVTEALRIVTGLDSVVTTEIFPRPKNKRGKKLLPPHNVDLGRVVNAKNTTITTE